MASCRPSYELFATFAGCGQDIHPARKMFSQLAPVIARTKTPYVVKTAWLQLNLYDSPSNVPLLSDCLACPTGISNFDSFSVITNSTLKDTYIYHYFIIEFEGAGPP